MCHLRRGSAGLAVSGKVALMGEEFELVRLPQRPKTWYFQVLCPEQWAAEEGILSSVFQDEWSRACTASRLRRLAETRKYEGRRRMYICQVDLKSDGRLVENKLRLPLMT